jgi:hypothetical protein
LVAAGSRQAEPASSPSAVTVTPILFELFSSYELEEEEGQLGV